SASARQEKATRSAGKSTQGSKSQQTSASESATAEEPMQTPFRWKRPHIQNTLTLELLTGPTYELMKGSCKSLVELEFFLEEVQRPQVSSWRLRQACSMRYLPLGVQTSTVLRFCYQPKSARDVYSKRRVIAVTELKIIEWHNYKHLDWITVRRDNDKLYKFKEGDFKRLRIQDI
nr:hypothetical protein [Tanacetum cinerariifolium]